MIEKKLSIARRLAILLAMIICLGVTVLVGSKVFVATHTLVRIGLAAGSIFNLVIAVFLGLIAFRGTVNLKTQRMFVAQMTWGVTVFLMLLAGGVALSLSDPVTSIEVVVYGLVVLVMAGVFTILRRINHAEITMQEKLLKIECRLSEIAELAAKK